MSARPGLTVVVPTRDRPGALARCLRALDRQSVETFEIVVVDDRSCDRDAVCAVVNGSTRARVVDGDGRGPAAARNLGAAGANGEIVCFTDDDCEPGPEWLARLAERFDAGCAVVAGPTRSPAGSSLYVRASQLVTNYLVDASRDSSGAVGFAPTSNIACRRGVRDSVPFDETFPTAAGEDRVWCDRLHERGHRIEFAPAAWVDHSPDLSFRGFWRQHRRYGAGAARYRQTRPEGSRRQPPRFYVGLLRCGLRESAAIGFLVVVAQVATAVGFARERAASS